MDRNQIAEIKKFAETIVNACALAEGAQDLKAQNESAARDLANAKSLHRDIVALGNVEQKAAIAEQRIADLKTAEAKATASKEATEKSLAAAKQELGTVTADLTAAKKMLAEIQAQIARIRGAVA